MAVAGLSALTGCTDSDVSADSAKGSRARKPLADASISTEPSIDPQADDNRRLAALGDEQAAEAALTAFITSADLPDQQRAVLAKARRHRRAHIELLRNPNLQRPETASPSPAPGRTDRRTPLPPQALERLVSQQRRASISADSGDFARLLGVLAASAAADFMVIAAATSSISTPARSFASFADSDPPDPSSAVALNATLSAEYAAVYAYGVLSARLDSDQPGSNVLTQQLEAAFAAHRARSDAVLRLVRATEAEAAAPALGYRVKLKSRLPAELSAAAGALELSAASVYADLVGAAQGATRTLAIDALIDASTRATGFGQETTAFPGASELL